MDRIPVRRRVLQVDVALEETSGEKVLRLPGGAAVLDERRECAAAAAINADIAGIVEGVAARLDVEDPGCAQPVLRRQRTSDQREIADQRGVEERAEAAD